MNLKKIAIYGAGGLGREVLVLLHQINEFQEQWNILGFYDDNPNLQKGMEINGYPILGGIEDLHKVQNEFYLVIAIGGCREKFTVYEKIQSNYVKYPVLIHPTVKIRPYQFVHIGEGSTVFEGAVLTANINIGKHVLVYLGCTVGHDSMIDDFSSLMPGSHIGGNTTLEKRVYIGSGATILQGIRINHNSLIGAGAVVNRDIPERSTAVGVPAKIIRKNAN